ncbi:alginate O-acetyltransferase AlgX-related protein [Limobrevibacterium gyesilva]|uniref:AlgX/AlgJ SGNH hydrolase-like domain-containing protein n=1 Tax=Limobrevibacterium gyesilva TaxID=2991712 RepID=A0AA41YN99_9PROT|nr:hypothetical protein [Limobrevibacterium gyesilva]MCW3475661.1 hypothetical protein [Limobrevibacterium gyesilva]
MYRLHNRILVGLCALAACVVLGTALWLEPLTGDLTRLGGYAENSFGWNGVEDVFAPPLAQHGRQGTHYDIVVIGDSFSSRTSRDRQTREGGFWTDFLAAETGLSVGVFDVAAMPLEQRLDSVAATAEPPLLVILELAERTLRARLGGGAGICASGAADLVAAPDLAPLPALPAPVRRNGRTLLHPVSADQAADHLKKTLIRAVLGVDSTPVVRLDLSRDDLFTSRRADSLLVYREDFDKRRWTGDDWDAIRCRLAAAQRHIEADGRIGFLFLMAPDKSSAYAEYLRTPYAQVDTMSQLRRELTGPRMPRLDLALRAAIARGGRDIYLPNDTHWGSAGSRIAAQVVIDDLRRTYAALPPTD